MMTHTHKYQQHQVVTAFCLFILLLLTAGSAQAEGYAGSAGAFLRMGSGAAALATGDAGVARAMGAEQGHYNPAGLPYAPANDVYLSYHVLSLDRRLAHVGALVQVPEISYWTLPMRSVALLERDREGPTLIREEDLPVSQKRVIYEVDEYIKPLASSILRAAEMTELDERPYLRLDNRDVEAGVLASVVERMAEQVRQRGLASEQDVVLLLEENYKRVQGKPAAVSLNWTHAGVSNIDGRNTNGIKYGELGFFENRFSLSFGLRLHRTLSAGVTAGVLYAVIPDLIDDSESLSSTTFGADVGLQFRPFNERENMAYALQTLTFGAAAYDLAGKHSWNTTGYWDQGTTKEDAFPNRYRAGVALSPQRGVNLALDVETDLDKVARVKGGAEIYVIGSTRYAEPAGGPLNGSVTRDLPTKPALILRAGVNEDRPTFGLGLVLHIDGLGLTRLDYAYVMEDVSPEPTQILTWRFRFEL